MYLEALLLGNVLIAVISLLAGGLIGYAIGKLPPRNTDDPGP